MQLETLQKAFGRVLLHPEGYDVLLDDAKWQSYIQENPSGKILSHYSQQRLALYEELLFNTVEDTMKSFFPYCKYFMERDWYDLIDEFRRQYPNKSYYLYKVGESFAEFLNTKTELVQKYPFLPHLADYQWLEVALYNAPDFSYPANFQAELTWSEETFEGYKPFWNPVSKFVTYPYPLPALQRQINQVLEDVERFEEFPMERLRVQEQSTNMFVYRDPEHFYVRMFELNPMTTAIVQLSQEAPTYMELFKTLQATTPGLQELPLENVIVEGVKFFHQCHEARMLLGSVSSV